MAATHLAEEIAEHLPLLSGEQQAAVLHVVRAFAESINPHDAHTSTVLRRLEELRSGAVEGSSWDEVKFRANSMLPNR